MKKGFTLIEILVAITIIGIIIGLSAFGLSGSRESARDATRKSDLESIRSALELYRADCNSYPPNSSVSVSSPIVGCPPINPNTYHSRVPDDPIAARRYIYNRNSTTSYELCAALEGEDGASVSCGGSSNCSGGSTCNYRITNP